MQVFSYLQLIEEGRIVQYNSRACVSTMTKRKSLFEDDDDGSSVSSFSSENTGARGAADAANEDHRKKGAKDDDDDSDGDMIQINTRYAHEFTSRKQKEELRRVRFERGVDSGDGGSSCTSEEEEDDDAALLTPQLDVNVLKTIRAVRTKDQSIYDPQVRFFDDQDGENDGFGEDSGNGKSKSSKPKRYKDVVREQVLEEMEKDDDAEDPDEDKGADPVFFSDDNHKTSRLAYDAQQKQFRKAFLESTKYDPGDDDDEVLVKRKQSSTKADDDKIQEELLEEIELIKATENTDDKYKLVDPRGEVEDGEAFLLDYFKNRPWIEKADDSSDEDTDCNDDRKPSASAVSKAGDDDEDASLQELEEADDFEAQYNFRFEQAAAATAASGAEHSLRAYARTMDTTLRRKDGSRAERRRTRKERKAAERQAKEEQLKRLKNAKRQELEEKLSQVKSVLGEVEGRGQAVDETTIMKLLEGDFDPDKFEELMKETYNDDFYEQQDEEWKNDSAVRESLKRDEDGKLLVGGDDEDGGLYDNLEEEYVDEETGGEEEDEEGWPDEYDEEINEEDEHHLAGGSELDRKLKAKVEDELYKLDYEDIVAGMPTRFKYRQVEPNSYGLSTEEILFARDSTLKQFVSLKKMAPYVEQEHFVGGKKRRRFRDMLKHDLEEELGSAPEAGEEKEEQQNPKEKEEEASTGTKKKKKRRRLKKGFKNKESRSGKNASAQKVERGGNDDKSVLSAEPESESKRKRRKKSKLTAHDSNGGSTTTSVEGSANTMVVDDPLIKEGQAGSDSAVEIAASSTRMKHHGKTKRKKAKRKKKVEGVTVSRLASYGL